MGSSSSKFKKYLQHGDEYAAMQVYQSSSELRKALQPNYSYGDGHGHNTPLHYAARHGMKHLIRTFLNDLDGNPNQRNALGQTALHCVCKVRMQKSPTALERRAYSVSLLLSWRGPPLPGGDGRERIEINAQDVFGYTALHYGAQSGLRKCIEYLVAHGADLFLENKEGYTPCDLAMRDNHHHIAQFLESKMVFSGTPESLSGESSGARTSSFDGEEEVYCGLRAQDLQEAKDQLLVETADMLHIPLFTAEALLRHAEWSRENLLDQWIKDPVRTCQMAGVQPTYAALQNSTVSQYEQISTEFRQPPHQQAKPEATYARLTPKIHSENSFIVDEELAEEGILCELCCDLMTPHPTDNELTCGHKFCTRCWKNYLHTKIGEGQAQNLLCPAFQCSVVVPIALIERHVSPQMARKYLKFDINAFVETNKAIKWCPYSSCQRAVNLPESEQLNHSESQVSHAVDCGGGHFFCWECGQDAHAPLECSQWQAWQARCNAVDPSELQMPSHQFQESGHCLWLVTNSRACPSCKSIVQKTDGCNHIRCPKCRHDFCWVCLEPWKKHNSAMGAYYRCNRYRPFEEDASVGRPPEQLHALRELHHFVHYYIRHKNHDNSRRMEEPLLHSAKKKRELLQSSLAADKRAFKGQQSELLAKNTKFYEDGVWELLKARQILCGSYAYGFHLEEGTQPKNIFEFMQNELEEVAEILSEMFARPYLRTPKRTIIQHIQLCRKKRQEFLRACYKGLMLPEPPVVGPKPTALVLQKQQHQMMTQSSQPPLLPPGSSATLGHRSSMPIEMVPERKRSVVEAYSDPLYSGGAVWTKDPYRVPQKLTVVAAAPGSQCGKCRRPSCTTQMCASRDKHLRAEDFDFNSLRRGDKATAGSSGANVFHKPPPPIPQHQVLSQYSSFTCGTTRPGLQQQHGTQAAGGGGGGGGITASKSQDAILSSTMEADNATPSDDYDMDMMMAYEMSQLQMLQESLNSSMKPGVPARGGRLKEPPPLPPRTSRSDDNLLLTKSGEDQHLNVAIEMSLKDHEPQEHHYYQSGNSFQASPPSPSSTATLSTVTNTSSTLTKKPSAGSNKSLSSQGSGNEKRDKFPDALPSKPNVPASVKQLRLSSKSISTDGTECRALPEWKGSDTEQGNESSHSANTDDSCFFQAANETVNSFLKNLTLASEMSGRMLHDDDDDENTMTLANEPSLSSATSTAPIGVVKMTGDVAEGKFKISEIHDSGRYSTLRDDAKAKDAILANLKRSQSTGDMEDYPESGGDSLALLDSDHSCSEKPEDDCCSNSGTLRHDHRLRVVASLCEGEGDTGSDTTSVSTATEQLLEQRASTVTTAETKKTLPSVTTTTTTPTPNSTSEDPPSTPVAPTSSTSTGRRSRPRFVRQKAYEIDSDSTDMDASLQECSPSVKKEVAKIEAAAHKREEHEAAVRKRKKSRGESLEKQQKLLPLPPSSHPPAGTSESSCSGRTTASEDAVGNPSPPSEATSGPSPTVAAAAAPKSTGSKKRSPGLTINIHNSSFVEDSAISDVEMSALAAKSPTLHISGVSISRSPGGTGQKSPKFETMYSQQHEPSSARAAAKDRNRSASLIVPFSAGGVLTSPAPRSPGSKSLHLSRAGSPTVVVSGKQQFTFPAAASESSETSSTPASTGTGDGNSIDWSTVDWDKLTPEEKWRLEHIKLHEKHRGHESMHAEMVLILIATLFVSQIALVQWKKRYPQSYHLVTLLGMWIIPFVLAGKNNWWRFICIWLVISFISGIVMKKALEKPIQGNTPRIVYKWFLLLYRVSYFIGILGYIIMMATFMGLYIFFGVKPHVWMDVGMLLLFYALYYGVMARDLAEYCAEKMASRIGYYQPSGIPQRQLDQDMCALCGNKFLVRVGEEGVMENTYRLSCSHEYHEFCIRGWCIVGKKQTCPYCHEKVDLKRMFPNPWEKPHMMYGQLLDWLRWLVCWQPIILVIVQGINWALGLE